MQAITKVLHRLRTAALQIPTDAFHASVDFRNAHIQYLLAMAQSAPSEFASPRFRKGPCIQRIFFKDEILCARLSIE